MQVMSVLWRRGSGTVASLAAELNDLYENEMGRTTVLTHLRRLRVVIERRLAAMPPRGRR